MYISAFPHRDQLYAITNRWLSNRLEPTDVLDITRIITYDSFTAWETMLLFINKLLKNLNGSLIHRKKISHKKELKNFICAEKYQSTERIKYLISEYKKMPEFFYIGSPITGYIYHDSLFNLLGMCRFKRVKRIAEKVSRYASMHIYKQVDIKAIEISGFQTQIPNLEKAIPFENFIEAEKEIMMQIKKNGIQFPLQTTTIRDVLGIKIVDHGYGEKKLQHIISQFNGAKIIEKETHTGNYNAIHYVVELRINFNYIIDRFKHKSNYRQYIQRGLPADGLYEDFEKFITNGLDTVQVDLIFTSCDELIESEIGRSMHEYRIFEQRQKQKNLGNIPINIEYIIEYLLSVGLSPTVQVDEIPIKIWGRYLSDTLTDRIQNLFQIPKYSLLGI